MDLNRHFTVFLALLVIQMIITICSQNHIFFGDMVQFGSLHPHFFLEKNFSTIWLPNGLDSGHPSFFGLYIAFLWKIFGKSLVVSHWAMFPFLVLIAYQIPLLVAKFINKKYLFISSLILFAEPSLLAQSTLVSPDVVLIAFFLLSLNLLLAKKYALAVLSLIPLGMISLRGMMAIFTLYSCFLFISYLENKKEFKNSFWRLTKVFFPAVFSCFLWLFFHYRHVHWIGFHDDSPWATSFQSVGMQKGIKNVGLMFWRLIDFGRFTVWIVGAYCFVFFMRNKIKLEFTSLKLIILTSGFILILACNTVFADGLTGHRYYIPIYLLFSLLVLNTIQIVGSKKSRWLAYAICLAGLLAGHRIIYPVTIAMGWDSTLAHTPYYQLREKMINYMDENEIDINKTGSGFPNLSSQEMMSLNGDTSKFRSYHLASNEYILWSNIFNFPDEEIEKLNDYVFLHEEKKCGIFLRLYKKRM